MWFIPRGGWLHTRRSHLIPGTAQAQSVAGLSALAAGAQLVANGPLLRLGATVSRVLPLLLFDGDCAFCASSVNALRRYVRPQAELQPWQHADLESLGVTAEQCRKSIQWISVPGAQALTQGRAVAAVLRVGRPPWPLVSAVLRLPGMAAAADIGYRVIAANRHRLPGSTPACRLPQVQVDEPSRAA